MRVVVSLVLLTLINFSDTVGLDVRLVSKNKGENRIQLGDFSRKFCNFLCGPDAFENSEFEQLQRLLDVDLSLFKSYPVNMEPNIHELEYRLYLAEEEHDSTKIKRINSQIENVKREWEENYDSINEGWIKVDELRVLTLELIFKLETNKSLHRELKFNFDWNNYFKYKIRKSISDSGYLDNSLVEDLKSLIIALDIMSINEVIYVAFYYG